MRQVICKRCKRPFWTAERTASICDCCRSRQSSVAASRRRKRAREAGQLSLFDEAINAGHD